MRAHFIMQQFAATVMSLVIGIQLHFTACGQAPSIDKKTKESIPSNEKAPKLDPRELVEAIVNHNPMPKRKGGDVGAFVFDSNFNVEEHRRAWKAIQTLTEHSQEAWPELVKHLDDSRYCTTFDSSLSSPENFTVGGICVDIVGRNLSEAYCAILETPMMYHRYTIPDTWETRADLKKWCEERKTKQLYELQLERCDWMLDQLRRTDLKRRLHDSQRKKWIETVERQIEILRATKKPVVFDRFVFAERALVSPQE